MVSYHRSSANDYSTHKHSKHYRHSHDKHVKDEMAREGAHHSRSRPSCQHADGPNSESSDEILIKGKASRRSRRDEEKHVARQLKSIEKPQRGSRRPSSSSSQEIQVQHVPFVTKSTSTPLTNSRQSQSRSSNSSKSVDISASDITSRLKGLTKGWLGRRSDESHKSSRRSNSRGRHEKRDKHGNKRAVTSKFLAPLAQRWVCYKCGKLRSDTIQERHPLKEGEKMQPNWCGKCRVHGELHGRRLAFEGQRHYCWGCGIVRSRSYHTDNPIDKDEMSTPNYCKPCRQVSPAFDYNLREASEIGSVASVREKVKYLREHSTYLLQLTSSQQAFCRQMRDADLSDVDEEGDDQSSCAPGKENQKPESTKKLKASRSFMLENCSNKVKTTSDDSSEGGVPLSILKALHLDEERARSTSGGGCRLSDGSYQPPTAESALSENCNPGLKTTDVTKEALSAIDANDNVEMKNGGQSVSDVDQSSPTVIFAPKQQDSSDGFTKKKVHWIKQAAQPMAAGSNASDSAYCSGYPSDVSYKSAGSRRCRRDPGDVSTGSPPVQEGEDTTGDLGHGVQKQGSGKGLPVQQTFYETARDVDTDTASYRRDSTHSSHSIPPTPPESFVPAATGSINCPGENEYESPITPWVDSPEISNFSWPYLSPSKQRAKVSHNPDPVPGSGFGARPGYMQEYSPYHSAAHFSDSTQSRDFSGYDAPDEDHASFHGERYGPSVQHGSWPPAGCPVYDGYRTSAEGDNGGFYGSYDNSGSFPPSTGYSTFDFSGLAGPSSSDAYGGDSLAPEGEKFVRKKKTTQDTPRQHSWHLYDDGDDDGNAPNIKDCKWRKDGRTTIHRSGGGQVPNEGKTVQILSIREIDSDEELSISEGELYILAYKCAMTIRVLIKNLDNDETSELDTVIGDDAMMKSICAA